MRIFLLGDFESDNGPGNANKQIKEALALKYEVEYSKTAGKIKRIFEMYKGIKRANLLLICSASQINYIAIKTAKKQGKKIIYLMHGCLSYETKLETPDLKDDELKKIYDYEKFIYANADYIVCVSKRHMEFMKLQMPQYTNKFDYIFNAVDSEKLTEALNKNRVIRKKNQILSIGGGMKRKNILTLAEAFNQSDKNITFIVVGKTLSDGEKIKTFNNVRWYEHVKYEKLCEMLLETSLYIQNSIFETFGLAVIEALYAGCSVLVSNTVGCLDLFENLTNDDIIFDVYDQKEIKEKAENLLENPNNHRLMKELKKDYISKEWQANRWQEIINSKILI